MLETFEPALFYGHLALFLLVFGALFATLVWIARRGRPELSPLLLCGPVFFASLSFFSGLFLTLFGRVNNASVFTAVVFASGVSGTFLRFAAKNGDLFGFAEHALTKSDGLVFAAGAVSLLVFYALSIDHNFVPAQYDAMTYQYVGDLLFRKHTFPVAHLNGGVDVSVLIPPGFLSIDYLGRVLWNDPRESLLTSLLFLGSLTCAFGVLVRALSNQKRVLAFVPLAVLSRGLFWNYWEFNQLRELSLICSVLYLGCVFALFRADDRKKENILAGFGGIFLGGVLMSHPENGAYILGGPLLIAVGYSLYHASDPQQRRHGIKLFLSFVPALAVFGLWFTLVALRRSPYSFLFRAYSLPVPRLVNFVFHLNGLVPVLIFAASLWQLRRVSELRWLAKAGLGLFLFGMLASYYAWILHFPFGNVFRVQSVPFDEFTGAAQMVSSKSMHPHPTVMKISGFWWMFVVFSALFFAELWTRFRSLKIRTGVFLLIGGLSFLDVFYMYYNRPVIALEEYKFLKALKPVLPEDALVVAPPGYSFSAWTGPVLGHDSLSNRNLNHMAFSLPGSLPEQIENAYKTGDFDFFRKNVNAPMVVLVSSYWKAAGTALSADPMSKVLLTGGDLTAYLVRRT